MTEFSKEKKAEGKAKKRPFFEKREKKKDRNVITYEQTIHHIHNFITNFRNQNKNLTWS